MAIISMKQLLESGVHFGHQTRRWNPKMEKYIYTKRNGIHIIDLQQTVSFIEDAYNKFLEMGKEGKKVLFVGTKKQAVDNVKAAATRAGHYFVTKRWLGGTLTNFKTIRKSVRRLQTIEKWENDGTFERLPKKEVVQLRKEMERLEMFLGGIKEMRTLPDAVFIVDTRKDNNAVREARKLKIPIFAMIDSNSDPDEIDHIIPANDDAIRSIKVIANKMADALIEGAGGIEDEAEDKAEEPAKDEKRTKPEDTKEEDKKKETPTEKPKSQEDVKKALETAPTKAKKETAKKPVPKKEAEAKKEAPAKPKAKAPEKEKPVAKKEKAPEKEKPAAQEKKAAKTEADLESLTVPELRKLAKKKGLTGYSKLRKAELIEALKK